MSHTLSLHPPQGPHAAIVDLGGDGGEERRLAQELTFRRENIIEKGSDNWNFSRESTGIVLTDKGKLEGSQGVGALSIGVHQ